MPLYLVMYGDGIKSVNRLPDPIPIYPRRVAPRPRLHTQMPGLWLYSALSGFTHWYCVLFTLVRLKTYSPSVLSVYCAIAHLGSSRFISVRLAKKNLTRNNVNSV